LAKRIAADAGCEPRTCDHALLAGLLHDSGKLVLAANLPEEYGRVLLATERASAEPWIIEDEVLGTTHAEAGAYLLGLWGIPDPIVEAIAFHHRPRECPADAFTPLTAVHVADAVDHDAREAAEQRPVPWLDLEYVSRLGLEERVAVWCELGQSLEEQGANR
jgi:HD-like signal output (HDOD) protein